VITRLVLLGASGDLAGRFLLPALAALREQGRLPAGLSVVGAAGQDWDDDAFRRFAAERLERHAADVPAGARAALVGSLRYRQVDVADAASVASLLRTGPLASGGEPLVAYLALPQRLFAPAVRALAAARLPEGSRVAIEKPFGEDQGSATQLNALLAEIYGTAREQSVFRIDHVLGMATVQNLIALRLANPVLEAVWNGEYVEEVNVLWEETLALEGRAGFYDRAGALKDVMQNHMMQVLSLAAMEPPASLGERELRDAKLDALRAVRPLRPADATRQTRRARYAAGRLSGTGGGEERDVPSYVDEDGVDPDRCTETFAELLLELDNQRWTGTRFRLRAGKALGRRRKSLVVRFRPVEQHPFGTSARRVSDELRIGLDGPEDLALRLTGSAPGPQRDLAPLELVSPPYKADLPAYARVLLDLLSGGSTLSVRGDEAEEAWRIVTPALQAWADGSVPMDEYPAGSDGPPPLDGSGRE
jgi:glucose-6-phosphate 1-dehydrogenase